jgi:extracellular elastinolytic metalloproteinase
VEFRSLPYLSLSAVAAAIALTFSPAQAADLDQRPAQVQRADDGRPLFSLPAAVPADVAAGYLRSRGWSAAQLASLRTARSGAGAHGVRHVRLEQVVDGLPVYGAYFKAAVNARGELVHAIDRLAPVSLPTPARVDAQTALQAALARVHAGEALAPRRLGTTANVTSFDGGPFFHSAPTVTAVAIPMDDGTLSRGWLVETWTAAKNLLHHTLVDGDGRVLLVEKRTASDSYNVYVEDPLKGPQTTVPGPAPGTVVASPEGWLGTGSQSTINISGNNANAYLDVDKNNRPDRGGTTVVTGNFLTSVDLTASPATVGNRAVSAQNLFYLNNVVHDILYGYGFDEAAGNFQVDNFGRGGKDGDPVQAEAQDGGDTDNADFATPPDGRKPRMQMYLFTGAGSTLEVVVSPSGPSYNAAAAAFGPALTTTGVTGTVSVTTPADGCTAISTVLSGKLALIDRGACDFSLKAFNAQAAGAVGVIIANNQGGTAIIPMGDGANAKQVRIPAVMISQNDGAALKALGSPIATERRKAVQPNQIDASLDADVVFHEYGHGLTWRMIGGMSGPLAGAIGEGASDGIAMLINGDDIMGEYSSSNPLGIRRFPYASYPNTYKHVTGEEVHNDGEIYGAIVWRMIVLFGDARRADLFRYVVDGMNYTPSTPTYEQMRDGILGSVAAGPMKTDCTLVWQAFAQFGVGVGATGVVNRNGTVTITESTATPATCN